MPTMKPIAPIIIPQISICVSKRSALTDIFFHASTLLAEAITNEIIILNNLLACTPGSRIEISSVLMSKQPRKTKKLSIILSAVFIQKGFSKYK
jgi:hypothetical protein